MGHEPATSPITIRAAKEMVSEIDSIAHALARSRNYVINQALQQYLEANAWQVERIKEGIADARADRVHPAEDVHDEIAAKHGFRG
ncbi:ribbon-helix-helix protein, CopG family [uncultured Roseovarius sp.]|uniref:CopG family ribbon-helix-helix protein n=1 Tax=uncultured Roseovarius sp. TaxID=293344 RepID=UPI00260A7DE1|nr:ribbon-helix-helix protein, CopG family [uncultured Roseovarius sp.]